MEATTLRQPAIARRGPTPLTRLQSDERLVALTRRGHAAAYEVLVARYQSRLLAFCKNMLGSREDAEDVLQEVFAAAFNAMLADTRPINVRPWLYRIARNRCLNHLRRQQAIGVDSMDVHFADHGTTTADRVHRREDFRELVGDVQGLPETQRTALLLRELHALSYEQIAATMDTTVPSVKSLLVRARVSLGEAAESRRLTCGEVREELGAVADGARRRRTPPVRRHVRQCDGCASFERELRHSHRRSAAAILPLGPLALLKKLSLTSGAAGAAGGATALGGTAGVLGAGASAVAAKAAAGIAAAALVAAGAVEVDHVRSAPSRPHHRPAVTVAAAPRPAAAVPHVVASTPQPVVRAAAPTVHRRAPVVRPEPAAIAPQATVTQATTTTTAAAPTPPPVTVATMTATTPEAVAAVEQPGGVTTTPVGSDPQPQQPSPQQTGGVEAPPEDAPSDGPGGQQPGGGNPEQPSPARP